MDIIKSIQNIYPGITGGYVYWETDFNGIDWENPYDGLVWENKTFSKPTWSQIQDSWDNIKNEEIKKDKIRSIKKEANKKILNIADENTQRNLMAQVIDILNKENKASADIRNGVEGAVHYEPTVEEKATIASSQAIKDSIFAIRTKSNELETSLDAMTLEELEGFDANDDLNWA